jgi:hypothetical protein
MIASSLLLAFSEGRKKQIRPASMKATITQIKIPSGQRLHVVIAYGVNTINV